MNRTKNYLEVTLIQPNSKNLEIKLDFELIEHALIPRWIDLVERANSNKSAQSTSWGMYADDSSMQEVVFELNRHINSFNLLHKNKLAITHYRETPENPDRNQKLLNRIHDQFDRYYFQLGCDKPDAEKSLLTRKTMMHLARINTLVHTTESLVKVKDYLAQNILCAWFVSSIVSSTKHVIPFLDEDHVLFTTGESFGDIFLDYPRVGKSLYDIFVSNDLELLRSGYEARPVDVISPGFLALFSNCPKIHDSQIERFYSWWDENNIDQFGYRKNDASNRIGLAKIGSLVPNVYVDQFYNQDFDQFDEFEMIKYCSPYSEAKEMKITKELAA